MPTAAVSAHFPAQNLRRKFLGDSGNQFATSREVDKARQLFGMPGYRRARFLSPLSGQEKIVD